jgi:glycosyltransferase involved in cell wall biosynthesis
LPEIAGDAAYLVDPFDINDIAKGINQLIEDESLRTELSKKGLQRSTYFSWDKAAEQVAKELGL